MNASEQGEHNFRASLPAGPLQEVFDRLDPGARLAMRMSWSVMGVLKESEVELIARMGVKPDAYLAEKVRETFAPQ